jgi:SAM-dependent methyltransferase
MNNEKRGISVVISNDPGLKMETRSVVSLVLSPVLNNLPKSFNKLIKKTDKAAASVIDNVTNHDALETLYSKGKRFKPKKILQKLFQTVWFNLGNSKAVRNRLKLVIKEIGTHLENIASTDREINVISIASGSSRAVVEVVENSHYLKGTNLSITFLDKNPLAIEYSKSLSKNISHFDLEWINDTVGNFFKSDIKKKFDVVEIVGLFDYFSDEKVLQTLQSIHSVLQEGGIVITANINHNREERFITDVVGWPMVYRTAEQLAKLTHDAGFSYDTMKVFYEPLKIHGMVVAKK